MRKSRKRYKNTLLIIFLGFFFVLACSPDKETSQVSYPDDHLESLFKYYDEDQLDSIVVLYQTFQTQNYSLENMADSVKLRLWAAFGYGLNKTGNSRNALIAYEKALIAAKDAFGVTHWKYGAIANNIALIFKNIGEYSKAIEFYKKDLGIDQSNKGRGETYNNLGALYRNLKKYDSAVYCYEQAVKLLPKTSQYYPLNNLGNVYSDLKEWEKARQYLNNAINLAQIHFDEDSKQRNLIASTYNRLAYTYLVNQSYEQALDLLEIAQLVDHQDVRTRLGSYLYQIDCLYKINRFQESLALAKEADQLLIKQQSSLLSQADKLFFVEQTKEFSGLGFRIGLVMGDLDAAFYFSERSKATVLQELNARIGGELASFQPLSISTVQKRMDANAALIEYKFTRDSLYAFVITQEEVQLLPVATALADSLAIAFRRNIMGGLIKEFAQIAPKVFEVIFAPLEESLAGKSKLLIIPDGSLSYIPWEALLREEPRSKETWKDDYFAGLSFLIKDYKISYHNAASLAFADSHSSPNTEQKLIGFSPVRFAQVEGKSFKPLKYAQEFAKQMSSFLPNSEFYTRGATKSKFKEFLKNQPRLRTLHIDTHGFVHPSESDSSALVFEDSLLYLREILELNTSSIDLLALATCSSGEGAYIPGEGIISLARGFISGGANNVIHSLWLANDPATASLFTYFYGAVKKGKTYSEALRIAKLQMIQEPGGHPNLWANFVLFERRTNPS